MSNLVPVYWLSLKGKRSVAGLNLKQEVNKWDKYLEEWDYINDVKANRRDHENEIKLLTYYLYSGIFTDVAFAEVGLHFFNQRVVDAFEGELEQYGRLYPIECEGAPWQYYIYNVTTLVKAMDLEAVSKVDPRYQPGEPYNSISRSKFEFLSENIKDLLVFKDIQQNPIDRYIYLSKRFVDILKKHKFTGVHKDTFKPIWPRPEPSTPQVGPKVDLADLNL
ncbi:MAG: DUF1629 domain-containing protein [Candidatus Sericytochromatia bacterium]